MRNSQSQAFKFVHLLIRLDVVHLQEAATCGVGSRSVCRHCNKPYDNYLVNKSVFHVPILCRFPGWELGVGGTRLISAVKNLLGKICGHVTCLLPLCGKDFPKFRRLQSQLYRHFQIVLKQ